MIYRAFNPYTDLDYARSVLTVPISSSTRGVVASDEEGQQQGIVLLDNWTDNAVYGHIGVTNPMALRGLHIEAMRFVFQEAGRKFLLGAIAGDNEKSLRFHAKLGFKVIYRVKDGWADGVDLVMVQMNRENCRYIKDLGEAA